MILVLVKIMPKLQKIFTGTGQTDSLQFTRIAIRLLEKPGGGLTGQKQT